MMMAAAAKKFKVEYAYELIRLAESDLESAVILKAGKARPENTLYHMEQVVEKSLKAILCYRKKAVPLTHDLVVILQALDEETPPYGLALADLTPYATIRRYEEGHAEISEEELEAALKMTQDVLVWAKDKLPEKT
ncbi:MAG: HEPN domain-containing protein [Pseudobdellovibrionaceae bacterium]